MVKIWFVTLLLSILTFGPVHTKENDPCRTYGKDGSCKPYSKCSTLETWNNPITACSIGPQGALVCCPNGDDLSSRNSGGTTDRISAKKCKEYRDLTRQSVAAVGFSLSAIVQRHSYPTCEAILQLIVGGKKAKAGEFPHMAALGWKTKGRPEFLCGGSLISDQFVLTAAHCYMENGDQEFPSFVRLGDQNLYRTDDGGRPYDAEIDDFILHDDFLRKKGWYNDIALIKLVDKVTFNNYIRPACLGDQLSFPENKVVATGFGYTETGAESQSEELLKVSLDVFDNELCTEEHKGSRQLRSGMKNTQLCVGSSTGGFDTCQGDSGGPIQIAMQENHCVYYVVGVTSFGPALCGSKTPAVYSRVGPYLDWIESHVWNKNLTVTQKAKQNSAVFFYLRTMILQRKTVGSHISWWTLVGFVVGLVLLLQPVDAALKENDPCKHNGVPGTCRRYVTCKDRLAHQRLTICRYAPEDTIVCCPNNGPQAEEESVNRFAESEESSNQQSAARISARKCNEYRKLSYNKVSVSTLTLNPMVLSFEVPKCDNIVKLIVGGNITKPGEFPHMAAIGWRVGRRVAFDCGGSLISNQYVLTAAHCNIENNGEFPSFVRLGDQNLARPDDGAQPIDVDIDSFTQHPNFMRRQGWYNDIGLIRLVRPVEFNNFIRPACLYDQLEMQTDQVIATGFGLTEDHGDKSDELLKVSLSVFQNPVCNAGYQNSRQLKKGIMTSQMCVGKLQGGADTCQGDSGGPLQITRQENHCVFYIVGITSFGQTCGSKVPAIYTRVASYLDWIEPIVWG
ncbi:uncharacterized protein LOC129738271 [Uranotaenia lowii]|uniref:uncharacterized protein LOC129738271 n=1 Tax=Uranotaenia lowii TaxID=190385 RepID=UPI00247AB80B|nr:uncharacterized protein LOC129738271 [Uranotaenia lowii]